LRLAQRANSLCKGLILAQCLVFQDVIVEALEFIAVGDVVVEHFFGGLA